MSLQMRAPSSDSVGSVNTTPMPTMKETAIRNYLEKAFDKVIANHAGQKVTFVPIGAQQARALQAHYMFSRQRNLRENNLRVLITGIQNDKFLNNNPIWICHQHDDDSFVVINGQHTLEAIIQADASFELPIVLDPVDTVAEVEQRYALFDMGAARTQIDILHMMDIALDIREEDDPQPQYASRQQIKRSAEAMTWLSTGLVSNASSWSKFERADAIRSEWHAEIGAFWRSLGDRRDVELAPEESAVWMTFWGHIGGGAFQAPFLASFRACPEETQRVLDDLVIYAKSGGALEDDESTDSRSIAIKLLYDLIMADSSDYYGQKRAILVWRVALHLKYAREGIEIKKNEEKRLLKQKGYSPSTKSWELATGGLIDKPTQEMVAVDMAGARQRREDRD